MKIAMAKELFRSGVFGAAALTENPMQTGWLLLLQRKEGIEILSNDKGDSRVFKGLEAGLKAAEEIGFKQVTVAREGILGRG